MVTIHAYLIHAEALKSCVVDFKRIDILHVTNTVCGIKNDNDLTGFYVTYLTKPSKLAACGNIAQFLLFLAVT